MTETTPLPDQPHEAATTPAPGILMSVLATFLAPMFLGITAGDVALARAAAIESMNAYQTRNHADLIAVAQIIAFGLAALGSLSLSMADDISPSMALRLRANANALNRSAEHNRRVLRETRPNQPIRPPEATFEPADADYEIEVRTRVAETQNRAAEANIQLQPAAKPVALPIPPTPSVVLTLEEQQNQAAWAQAMADVANEFTTSTADLAPAARKEASHRAALLSGCANDLLSGTVPPRLRPGDLAAFVRSRIG